MPAAPLPADEERRLAALYRYLVLDSDEEQCFDELTRLAAVICGTPVALISLLDRDRQWCKSVVGLPVRQLPRTQALCGYAILQDDVFVVADTTADPRFTDNPFVTSAPGFAFYAGAPLTDSDGNKLGTLCVLDHSPRPGLTDDQRAALMSLAGLVVSLLELREVAGRLATLSESSADCVYRVLLGPQPRLDYVSGAVVTMTGWTSDELCGDRRSVVELVHPEDVPLLTVLLRGTPPAGAVELRLLHKDGRVVWSEHHVRTVLGPDGSPVAAYGTARDTTGRHENEMALRAARAAAERAHAAKDDLLSRVSHELRTPLNAVLGFAQLLEMDVEGEQAAAVEQISRAGRHLLRIVDEVLSLSAASPSRSEAPLVPVPVHEVVEEVVLLVGPDAQQRDVSVSVTAGSSRVCALADRQQLTEAVANLVANAVKYNVAGGSVHVAYRDDGGRVQLSVADTGSGLDEVALERVFTPFERLDAEARGIAGTGLGLALARKAVEQMDGSLAVTSSPGVGSVFTITLGLAHAAPCRCGAAGIAALPQTRGPEPEPELFRVVYVEDNDSNRTLVQRVLDRRGGVALSMAVDGPSGVALVRETLPDLVLLDLHLPGLDGTQVLEALRADPATSAVPVVVLTADAMPDTVARLQAQGVAALLTKPLDIRELLVQVDEHAGQAVRA